MGSVITGDQGKIAKELSAEQLQELLDRCWKTPGLTLQKIADLAEEYGVQVSLMGATTFRDTTFAKHLQAIRSAAEMQRQMAEIKAAGGSKSEFAEILISQKLVDRLVEFDAATELAEDGGIGALNVLGKIAKRLSDSERGTTALKARLEEFERREAERAEKDRRAAAELDKLRNPKAALSDSERAAIVGKIDDILGIKAK